MRLTTFMNENNDAKWVTDDMVTEAIGLIERKCKIYLKNKGKFDLMFYAGIDVPGRYKVQKSTVDKPVPYVMGHDKEYIKLLNEAFKNKFKWYVLSGVPGTGNPKVFTEQTLFPIGDYDFVWSHKFDSINWINPYSEVNAALVDGDNDTINKLVLDHYMDSDLPKAVKSGKMIYFNCAEYIVVGPGYYDRLLDWWNE